MQEPVRILHTVVKMGHGGAETLIMNIYRNIDRSKVQFDFLTSKEGDYESEIKALGGKIYRIPYIDIAKFSYPKSLYDFFKEHPQYTIVHSHMDKMSGVVLREAKKAGVPIRIAHSHSTKNEGNLVNKLIKDYYGHYINGAANFKFACSKTAQAFLYGKEGTAQIIKNGIETQRFHFDRTTRAEYREKYHLEKNFVVGHVGRFNEPKNHLFLVEVFSKIVQKKSDAVLVLVGQGKLEGEVRRKVKQLNLQNNVLFLGQRDDIAELLQMMDVFVFPSIYEGFPMSLVEAQASGLECIVSDVITKEVELTDKIRFLPLDCGTEAWCNEILKEKNNDDREEYAALIENEGFDINTTIEWLQSFYISKAEGLK